MRVARGDGLSIVHNAPNRVYRLHGSRLEKFDGGLQRSLRSETPMLLAVQLEQLLGRVASA